MRPGKQDEWALKVSMLRPSNIARFPAARKRSALCPGCCSWRLDTAYCVRSGTLPHIGHVIADLRIRVAYTVVSLSVRRVHSRRTSVAGTITSRMSRTGSSLKSNNLGLLLGGGSL
jgi:hypothetical protein